MNKKQLAIPALLMAITLGLTATASATSLDGKVNIETENNGMHLGADMHMKAGDDMNHGRMIFGKVTAVNGTTLTITSLNMDKNATTQTSTTYTVNAASAVIDKNQKPATVSTIAVGDNIMVEGTISGTTITAIRIHDGVMAKGNSQTPVGGGMNFPEGNGQPIIGGTVTAVNGTTITITNKSNVVYTIDASKAKITKRGTTATVSNIAVGDTLIAQGTVNGTSVSAVSIVDSSSAASANASPTGQANSHVGFFGAIGNFFARIFGFGK